jgi:hypothetical protein
MLKRLISFILSPISLKLKVWDSLCQPAVSIEKECGCVYVPFSVEESVPFKFIKTVVTQGLASVSLMGGT